jgi:hypothetical protein
MGECTRGTIQQNPPRRGPVPALALLRAVRTGYPSKKSIEGVFRPTIHIGVFSGGHTDSGTQRGKGETP